MTGPDASPADHRPQPDLRDLPADHPGRRWLEVAAGGHHVTAIGPDLITRSLAERLPGLLPDLDQRTNSEVAVLHELAGLRRPADQADRPWRELHFSALVSALNGQPRRPGALALAHGGVLICDRGADFAPRALDLLCSVLDRHEVGLTQGRMHGVHPARFQIFVADPGCPLPPDSRPCDCPLTEHRRRLAPLDRLRDRIELGIVLHEELVLQIDSAPPNSAAPTDGHTDARAADPQDQHRESTTEVAARVAAARDRAHRRWTHQEHGARAADSLAGGRQVTNAMVSEEMLTASLDEGSGGYRRATLLSAHQ